MTGGQKKIQFIYYLPKIMSTICKQDKKVLNYAVHATSHVAMVTTKTFTTNNSTRQSNKCCIPTTQEETAIQRLVAISAFTLKLLI